MQSIFRLSRPYFDFKIQNFVFQLINQILTRSTSLINLIIQVSLVYDVINRLKAIKLASRKLEQSILIFFLQFERLNPYECVI